MSFEGYQYIEERDSGDNIIIEGVVSKKSAFTTSDNQGIFDAFGHDLNWLYENCNADTVKSIRDSITNMYEDMKTNPDWGATSAKLEAEKAIQAAKDAQATADKIQATSDTVEEIADARNEILEMLSQIRSMKDEVVADTESVRTNSANARVSETNAKAYVDKVTIHWGLVNDKLCIIGEE